MSGKRGSIVAVIIVSIKGTGYWPVEGCLFKIDNAYSFKPDSFGFNSSKGVHVISTWSLENTVSVDASVVIPKTPLVICPIAGPEGSYLKTVGLIPNDVTLACLSITLALTSNKSPG